MRTADFHVFILFRSRPLLIPLFDGVAPEGNHDFFHAPYRFPKIMASSAMRMETPLRT